MPESRWSATFITSSRYNLLFGDPRLESRSEYLNSFTPILRYSIAIRAKRVRMHPSHLIERNSTVARCARSFDRGLWPLWFLPRTRDVKRGRLIAGTLGGESSRRSPSRDARLARIEPNIQERSVSYNALSKGAAPEKRIYAPSLIRQIVSSRQIPPLTDTTISPQLRAIRDSPVKKCVETKRGRLDTSKIHRHSFSWFY